MKRIIFLIGFFCWGPQGQGQNALGRDASGRELSKTAIWKEIAPFFTVPAEYRQQLGSYRPPLKFYDGRVVKTPEDWKLRRKEILYLFSKNVYGQMPKSYDSINFVLVNADYTAMSGRAHMKQVRIEVWKKGEMLPINVVLFLPARAPKPVAAFILINNRGTENTDVTRKTRSTFWPAELVIDSGYAVAAFHVNDAAPDNPEHYQDGVLQLYPEQIKAADGMKAVGAWAWAASRVMDYLLTDTQIDPKQVAVVGHSRGGKAALWAGAQDQRFKYVFSNCSGNTGAALSRRMFGETVKKINTSFPHWFNDNYKKFNDSVNKLPVDQHMLIGLIAPRPVYITNATKDLWADPVGSFLALKEAEKVYSLYSLKSGLGHTLPLPENPVIESTLGYHLRTGEHDLNIYDWTQFVKFVKYHAK
ncbi:MAG: acetylxylan esterase [Chitinophagaceae bacterium]|nr:MAG: acetylxylan esterase [Chitinophagaceae bacterium]